MRKTGSYPKLCVCACLLAHIAAAGSFAQDTASSAESNPPALPTDPADLMLLAAKSNGLAGDDIKPWHLKASFQLTDSAGKTTDEGTIEESWAGPEKWKRSYTSTGFTQTIYGTDHGSFHVGAQDFPPRLLSEVFSDWINPLPRDSQLSRFNYEIKPQEMGGVKLTCVIAASKEGFAAANRVYCFNSANPILRVASTAAPVSQAGDSPLQTIYNKTVQFQGRYVATNVHIKGGNGTSLSAHIESLELLPSVDEADFTPPPDAKSIPKLIPISAAVAQGNLLRMTKPQFPDAAREARMSGTVVVEALITKDGHVRNAHVVSGAKIFQQAALDAVNDWLYRPYLLNGEPVDVQTTINLVFNLGPPR